MTQTMGEFRVDVDFNPSGDETVGRIKRAAADLIDLIEEIADDSNRGEVAHWEVRRLKALAMTHVEEGAMWAVKAATKREPDGSAQ